VSLGLTVARNYVLLTLDSPYSWRRQRRAAQVALSKEAVRDFYPILTKEATLLVAALLTNSPSGDRTKHFQRTGTSVIMSILYDYPTLMSENDTTINEIDNYNKRAAYAATPGNFLVEFFPWMLYIPARLYIRFLIYPY
jgi:cytochrome P450